MGNKIGIVTFWTSNSNYGQILQNAALQYYLRSLGYTPVTLSFNIHSPNIRRTFLMKIERILCDEISIVGHIKRRLRKYFSGENPAGLCYSDEEYLANRHFNDFKEKYICYSPLLVTKEDLVELNKDYSAFITGSDQVWTSAENDELRQYAVLLSFVKENIPRISYAASFGRNNIINNIERNCFKSELLKFSSVSCREESGLFLCGKLGYNDAKLVLDPTLLLTENDWVKYLNLPAKLESKSKKVFIYSLQNCDKRIYEIYHYLELQGFDIQFVCSASFKEPLAKCEATIEEWLQNIRESDMVITDSFHGTIFALNFHTPVISLAKPDIPIDKSGNARMYSFLNNVGLLAFLVQKITIDSFNILLKTDIDWLKVDNYIVGMRNHSFSFLHNALSQL